MGRTGPPNVPAAVAGGVGITVLFNELKMSFLAINCSLGNMSFPQEGR